VPLIKLHGLLNFFWLNSAVAHLPGAAGEESASKQGGII
jgi:hypothetical protein